MTKHHYCRPEAVQWLKDTLLKGYIYPEFESFELIGEEIDALCPFRIVRLYRRAWPMYNETWIAEFTLRAGGYVRT